MDSGIGHRDAALGIPQQAPGIGSGLQVLVVSLAVLTSVSRVSLESLAVCLSYVSISSIPSGILSSGSHSDAYLFSYYLQDTYQYLSELLSVSLHL